MAQHNDTGKVGEELARQFLVENGYAILETNWRLGKLEADIIAYKEGVVVFVEVKTRSSLDYGEPVEFVSRSKQRGYVKMANVYMSVRDRDEEARFDIIGVDTTEGGYRINHFPDAFRALDLFLR